MIGRRPERHRRADGSGSESARPRLARRAVVAVVAALAAVTGLLPLNLPLGANAVPAEAAKAMGSNPFNDILLAADAAAANARAVRPACTLGRDQLAALMMAPIYPEAGGNATTAPSPMTLSRWDTQSTLYAFSDANTSYRKAFFHPGIGLWQFDSSGGWNLTAADAINTQISAPVAAAFMADRFCASGGNRAAVWSPWFACRSSTCESIYNEIFDGNALVTANLNLTAAVGSKGGMVTRQCVLNNAPITCFYVDPAVAQGNTSWASSNSSIPTPISAPFYVMRSGSREVRVWLAQDSGYDATISADKPVTVDARKSISWSTTTKLCDQTTGRGSCGPAPRVAATSWGNRTELPFGSLDGVTPGVLAVSVGGWAIDPDTNDPLTIKVTVDGTVAGTIVANKSRPDVGANVPGYGNLHGFNDKITGVGPGAHNVCAVAVNVGPFGASNPQLGCQIVVVEAPEPGPFIDVDSSHPFVADIQWLVDQGITNGYPDQTFRPTEEITREAIAVFLWRSAGQPAPASNAPTFTDVAGDHPFATAIRWAAGAGIATGFGDGTFRPSDKITRQAVAAFLWRAAGEPAPAANAPTFPDVPGANPFAVAIRWMAGAGVTDGYPDGFRPGERITRQATAAFLHRADPHLW